MSSQHPAEPVPRECVPSPTGAVFLNISNHPSSSWAPAQIEAAQTLAPRVVDLPFPKVDPSTDERGIDALAQRVLERLPTGTTAAMVQGEFTLSFRLVRALEALGVPCFAATTERCSVEQQGRRISQFRFVRLRRYR